MSSSEKWDGEVFCSWIKSLKPSISFTATTEQDGWFFMHFCNDQRAADEHVREPKNGKVSKFERTTQNVTQHRIS